jgi:hypothetical protein
MVQMRFLCRIIESILRIYRDRTPDANQFTTSPEVLKLVKRAIEVLTKEEAILKPQDQLLLLEIFLIILMHSFGFLMVLVIQIRVVLFSLVITLIEVVNHEKLFSFYVY